MEGQAKRGMHVRTDLSVRLSDVPALIERGRGFVRESWPGWTSLAYGHAGDGNIHFNVLPPESMSAPEVRQNAPGVLKGLYRITADLGGSFSAEHGVGRSRQDVFWSGLSPDGQALLRSVKAIFDPLNIMNPGCLVREEGETSEAA